MQKGLLTVLLLGIGSGFLSADAWLDNYQTALKQSAASGKPVLVDITGSDWCPPCQQMDAEVFNQPSFDKLASAKFILLRLDYPRKTPQSAFIKSQNQKLSERYPFDAVPTYMILDSDGSLVGKQSGYIPGGVPAFLALTDDLASHRDTLRTLKAAVAASTSSTKKAQAEDTLFQKADDWNLQSEYGDLPLKIIQDDADNAAGLKERYQVYTALDRLLATWTNDSDFHQAVKDLDSLSERAKKWPDIQQRVFFVQGMVWLNALQEETHARDSLLKAKKLDPQSRWGVRAAQLLERLP